MDFFLVGVISWTLIIIAPVTFIYGLFKRSWIAMLVSGLTSLPIALYLGVGGEIRWALLIPLIPLFLAYEYYRKL